MTYTRNQILDELRLFRLSTGGLGSWITEQTHPIVLDRIARIDDDPITKVQLNQLLAFGHEAPISEDFFQYYWLKASPNHPYDVKSVPDFDVRWLDSAAIMSMGHLKWGLHRLYTDSLLWFGNVRSGYRKLRTLAAPQLETYFVARRFDTELIAKRGPALPPVLIARDDRYLIAEMACKSYGETGAEGDLRIALVEAFRKHQAAGGGGVKIRDLLQGELPPARYRDRQPEFLFSADDVLEEIVITERELEEKYDAIAVKFVRSRDAALQNTRLYLSMVGDLDVYVATSMRSRQDFRDMATVCDTIFSDARLKELQLRYFDPTLSAAAGHEDKGLIECLMVKSAKVLVFCAGDRDSYGKDAEAAMALSLGKPVIFYCNNEHRYRFYRDVHPLSRLIDFNTGVAVGSMVTDKLGEVSELLHRIFTNRLEYVLEQTRPDYLRLKEKITDSVVRLQTSDQMLTETFWNYYHNKPDDGV